MSTQPSPQPSAFPEIHPHLCSQGVAMLRAACKTKIELEALEVRLLLSGVVTDPTQDQAGLVNTDTSTTSDASTGVDTGITDMSSLIQALAASTGDPYSAWTAGLPSRSGYTMVNGVRTAWSSAPEQRNQPIGNDSLYAINPGRVVWVYDPAATHSAAGQTPWTNPTTSTSADNLAPYWWQNDYTDQYEIDTMVAQGVMQLTGTTSVAAAWDALFRAFNREHGNGNVGYAAGETIAIKCNLNTETSYTQTTNEKKNTPQVISAVLDQLVNVVGVAQSDIYMYDDLKVWSAPYWNYYNSSNTSDPHLYSPQTRFPQVNWMGNYLGTGLGPNGVGGTASPMTSNPEVFYAWGASSYIPQFVFTAKYAINMSVLSAHNDAGCTFSAKNYIGAIGETPNDGGGQNGTIHNYRTPSSMGTQASCFTSFLANEYLGQKNILYMTDALYGGWDWGAQGNAPWSLPTQWSMAPFGDGLVGGKTGWPSSLLMSQDPIALDSVDYDFLMAESETGLHHLGDLSASHPCMDDYLHESAELGNPASQTNYLGVADIPSYLTGTSASLGIHEHWDNALDKKYSRNLNPTTGTGIELLEVQPSLATPAAPSNLQLAAVSSSEVDLTWTDNSDNELGFKIERATDTNFTLNLTVLGTTAANVQSYADTTVAPQTTYYYRVRAINGGQESANATAGPVTTPADTSPFAPFNLAAAAVGATQVNLTWALGGSNDRGIKIERAADAAFTQNDTLLTTTAYHATSYTDTTVAAGTTYYYRVRATNGAGDSANSNIATTTTASVSYVVGLTADFYNWTGTPGSANIDLSGYTPVVTRTDSQVNYAYADNPTAWASGVNTTNFVVRETGYINITTAGSYTFYLNSDDGSYMWLDGAAFITNNDGGHGMQEKSASKTLALGYHAFVIQYMQQGGGAGLIFSYAGPSLAKQVVPAAALYHFSADTSPPAPLYLAAVPVSPTCVNLTWVLGGSNDRGVRIERATDAAFTQNDTLLTTTVYHVTSYSDSTAAAGTTYYYRVRATNDAGDSANSNTAMTATGTASYTPGVKAELFDYSDTSGLASIPDMTGLAPNMTLYPTQINYPNQSGHWNFPALGMVLTSDYDTYFAARFTGSINITTAGSYTFSVTSNDGSRMYLDGTLITEMNQVQGPTEQTFLADHPLGRLPCLQDRILPARRQ